MKTTPPHDPSRLRQALRQTEEQHTQRLNTLIDERGPLIRGSFVVQAVPCGKARCKCLRGEPHPRAMLYVSDEGAHFSAYVPQGDRERVERANRQYRRFREARAEITKLTKHTLELADALQAALTEPYPPPGRARGKRPGPRQRGSGKGGSS